MRARAEGIFWIFFWQSRLRLRLSSRNRAAQHQSTDSIAWVPKCHLFFFFFLPLKVGFHNAMSRVYCIEWAKLLYNRRHFSTSQLKNNWHNLSWITIGWCNIWLLCTGVGCSPSATNGLGCLQVHFLFCTGMELKYLISFLKDIFWHMINSLHLRGRKLFPDIYLGNKSRVPKGFVPGRH